MALGAALVDRARVVRTEQTGVRVEGRTQYAPTTRTWFRCRLTLPSANESEHPAGSRRRVVKTPMLLYGVKDVEGQPVAITFTDYIEVDSRELGRTVWQADGEPEPLRKRRTVIGFETRLKRVEGRERERIL